MPGYNETVLPGIFLTLEGGEGAGKSSLMTFLASRLQDSGYTVVTALEPGGTKLGEYAREAVLSRDLDITVGTMAELLLYLTARAQNLEEVILPALKDGKVVLCDRWHDSSIAYQGYGRQLGADKVAQVCSLASGGLDPDLTLFLDVPPDVGLARSKSLAKEHAKAGEGDRIEAEDLHFHQRVHDGYLNIANNAPDRIHILDATQPESDMLQAAWDVVAGELGVKKSRS